MSILTALNHAYVASVNLGGWLNTEPVSVSFNLASVVHMLIPIINSVHVSCYD